MTGSQHNYPPIENRLDNGGYVDNMVADDYVPASYEVMQFHIDKLPVFLEIL